jgi:hypothetical protein
MEDQSPVRRRPRYILGTFWLLIGVAGLVVAVSEGEAGPLFVGALAFLYSVYLYRGGRFGFIVW